MISVEYIKQVVQPKDLALRIIGTPFHRKNGDLWYKSPIRAEERTASFEVSDRGFHDFGTGEHFDVISFTQRWYSCSFKEAIKILSTMYGLADNEYETEYMKREMEQRRRAMAKYKEKIESWFVYFLNFVEYAWDDNEACIKAMRNDYDTLAILYDRQTFLGCLREEIFDISTFEEKERFKKQVTKEGLPRWMKDLEIYFSTHTTWNISPRYQT